MTTDPYADPDDVAEQQQDATPAGDEEDVPGVDPDELPLEADEADVVEQRTRVSGWSEEDYEPGS